jgi:cell division protein FtsW
MASAAVAHRFGYAALPRGRFGSGWEAPLLLALTLIALAAGMVTVHSASAVKAQSENLPHYHYLLRQAIGGAMGIVLMVAAARLDYRRLRILAWPILLATMAALLLIILPFTQAIAPTVNGARRWLNLGPLVLQPSEFAKITLIIWTAALAVKKQEKLGSLSKGLAPFLVVWMIVATLIAVEPSLSAAMLTVLLAGLVLFAAGARISHFVVLGLVALPVVIGQISAIAYRINRWNIFRNREIDITGLGYQITQALTAVGSGGLLGRGFGHGQQKFGFLPEPHNDFILAMIGEEWGFLGVTAVIVLFTLIALTGYRIARHAPDLFGFLLAIGLTNLIAMQALLHIAVNLAVLPTTGVTLPFMSYGRSSLLVCMVAVGILISIARGSGRRME